MCLIVVAWQAHPDFPLVVAANRDEFYERPTQDAEPWPEAPHIIAGRDLQAGGTWMGISTTGRFAAITNVREPGVPKGELSRGALTRDFLLGDQSAETFLAGIDNSRYSGYNLLLSDGRELWYQSNRHGLEMKTPLMKAKPVSLSPAPSPAASGRGEIRAPLRDSHKACDGGSRRLQPGIYAVSNHLLDTPWPKLVSARSRFAEALPKLPEREDLFAILADDEIVPDEDLPNTGVPLDWERLLSAIFVKSDDYGTRASTVLACDKHGSVSLEERRFGVRGTALGRVQFERNG